MKAILLMEKLKAKPVFRVQDVERLASCNRNYAKLLLGRLKRRGLIKSITRGVYTTKDNIFLIASNITYPSYISFWSASYFLGYTEQIVNTVQVATTRKVRPVRFGGYRIEFVPIRHFFGYRKLRTSEGELFVAEDEKLLVDAFLRPDKCGNYDEIEKIFEGASVEGGKIIAVLKKVNVQHIIKRVGYLLEKTKKMDVSGSFRLDRNYVVLNPFSKKWSVIDKKWRVKI